MLLYDRDNTEHARGDALFATWSRMRGYPEHARTWIWTSRTFDYATMPEALSAREGCPDPILAPGKQGVWPRAWRDQRGR
jgi:hypothetical protein